MSTVATPSTATLETELLAPMADISILQVVDNIVQERKEKEGHTGEANGTMASSTQVYSAKASSTEASYTQATSVDVDLVSDGERGAAFFLGPRDWCAVAAVSWRHWEVIQTWDALLQFMNECDEMSDA